MSGSNKLVVRISAVDATSQAIDAVSKRLSGLTAPATKVTKSLARLSDATGVTKLSKAIVHLGGTAVRTSERFVGALAPLGALTAALSLGGFAKMTSDWARFSQGLGFDATRIGANVSRLHALEGSATLAGSSAEAAANGLRTLQDTMTDTIGGRNMQALVAFRQLNVAFDDGRGHALRATEVMPKLADALSKISDRSIRARVGTMLLGGAYEELAPWIDLGSKGMEEYARRAAFFGVQTGENTIAARAFALAQGDLTLAFKGLGNSISEKVSPPLAHMMEFIAQLVGHNRTLIADKFGSWAEKFGKWVEAIDWEKVGSATERMATNIASITDSLSKGNLSDAWRKFMQLFGIGSDDPTPDGKIPMPRPAGVESDAPPLTPGQHTDRGKRMMGMFEGAGWSHEDAAAILSGLDRESGLRDGAVGDSGLAYGAAQWHPDRQAQFNAWSKNGGTDDGRDIRHSSIADQTNFINWDLTKGKYKFVGDHMRAAKTRDEKVAIFDREYESPKDTDGAIRTDIPRAGQWAGQEATSPSLLDGSLRERLERAARGDSPSDAPSGTDAPRPPWHFPWPHLAPAADQPGWIDNLPDGPLKRTLQPTDSKHEVTIKVETAPGTHATTTTTGTGPSTVRVEHSMVPGQ